jgi:prepilin peptidase CpaA
LLTSLHHLLPRDPYQGFMFLPLAVSLWLAWGDLKTRRIPNYLTFGLALAGFGFQLGWSGLPGLGNAFLGLATGFGLLIIPYILGGMGAGDVKALAALGAWLGPYKTVELFIYMAVAGGLMALGILLWRGRLWAGIRGSVTLLINGILCRHLPQLQPEAKAPEKLDGIPYGVAMALGMVALVILGD